MGDIEIEECLMMAYIQLLLGFGETVASTSVNKEDNGVYVWEILSPDLASYNIDSNQAKTVSSHLDVQNIQLLTSRILLGTAEKLGTRFWTSQ